MAVFYPSEEDRDVLLRHARLLRREDDAAAPVSAIFFTDADLTQLAATCDAILRHIQHITHFFTLEPTREDLAVRHNESVRTPPSPRSTRSDRAGLPCEAERDAAVTPFLQGSVGDLLRQTRVPLQYYTTHEPDLDRMHRELHESRLALRALNAEHGFLWTTDMAVVTEYANAYERRRRQRVHMRAATPHESPAGELETSTTTSRASSKSMSFVMPQRTNDTRSSTLSGSTSAVSGAPMGSQLLLELPPHQLASAQVQTCYASFILAADSILAWLDAGLCLARHGDDVPQVGTFTVPLEPDRTAAETLSATPSVQESGPHPTCSPGRTRTVRVRRYEVHDVRSLYDVLAERAGGVVTEACTVYDPRLRRRLLRDDAIVAVRELVRDVAAEVARLAAVAARRLPLSALHAPDLTAFEGDAFVSRREPWSDLAAQTQAEAATIVFRPPLSALRVLQESLRLYLSVGLTESERSGWGRFRNDYDAALGAAREVTRVLQSIPRPTAESAEWVPSCTQREELYRGFEAYWMLREQTRRLRDDLERDMGRRNVTHVVRLPAVAVRDERDAFAVKAERWVRQLALRQEPSPAGSTLWRTATASLRAFASLLTCKAELPTSNAHPGWGGCGVVDEDGVALSTTSPLCAEKRRLRHEVEQLWKLVEVEGGQLERTYPSLFHRSERHRWMRHLDDLVRKANAATVVFD